ncbi:MAG: hypothetical protein IBX61_02195 [Thermoleophilia bacterium]|nr:hypothetical protein [Thermoleophilia bacterium]
MLTLGEKSVLATVLLGLSVLQLVAIATARGWIGRTAPPARRKLALWHRLEGYAAIALILVISYYCIQLYPGSGTTRVSVHIGLGITVISLSVLKVAVMRLFPRFFPLMPLLGALLFTALIAIWISSAGWYYFWLG